MKDNPFDIRVRFAPSPTGYLHVGGARTALFNWLFAKKNNGKFILRIEDTDLARSSDEMTKIILDSMQWLGLYWDEGPFKQSERLEKYRYYANKLINEGKAYYCYCSEELLNEKRKIAEIEKKAWKYDGTCRNLENKKLSLTGNTKPVVRFKVTSDEGKISFDDLVHGTIQYDINTIDDFIIVRSDGMPTYNFSVVVDDADMKISHVIRGDDHISNTPKQILLYKALNFPIPQFAHLPLILGKDKSKLSKRHGEVSVGWYKDNGYLPSAMINFLALLGWSPKDNREILSIEEIISAFSLDGINKSNAIFDNSKLDWLNGEYISKSSDADLLQPVVDTLINYNLFKSTITNDWLIKFISLFKSRVKNLRDFVEFGKYFFVDKIEYSQDAIDKYWKDKEIVIQRLSLLKDSLISVDNFCAEKLESLLRKLAEKEGVKAGDFIHPTRVALTGQRVSPGLFEVMELMGKELAIKRLINAINFLESL